MLDQAKKSISKEAQVRATIRDPKCGGAVPVQIPNIPVHRLLVVPVPWWYWYRYPDGTQIQHRTVPVQAVVTVLWYVPTYMHASILKALSN